MDVISLINMKGGVGKSTTAHNLAGAVAASPHRVLLLVTTPVVAEPGPARPGGRRGPGARGDGGGGLRRHGDARGRDPNRGGSGHRLGPRVDPHRPPQPPDTRGPWPDQVVLRDFLAELGDAYDITLIDNPPNLHLCSWAALSASGWVLIPVQPEDYGAQGLAAVRRSIARVRTAVNPDLRLLGYLITMVQPRRAIHQLYDEQLRADYGADVLATRIPAAADFPEAVAHRKPVTHYKPRSAAAKSVKGLADEVLARLAVRTAADQGEAA